MLTSAPWLTANNPLQAAEAGARLGLQARGQDVESMDAGRRLRYSYDALAQSQENQRRQAQMDAAQLAATYSLRQSSQDAMTQYRNQQIQDQQDRLKQTADKTAQAADLLKTTHQDTAGFVDDAETMGAAKALAKHPNADKTVVNHVMALEAQKAKTPKAQLDKSYVDYKDPNGPLSLMHIPLDDPVLNKVAGTNAAALGTNYVSRLNGAVPSIAPVKQLGGNPPPKAAIDFLIKNPDQAKAFDAKYGDGASDQFLP